MAIGLTRKKVVIIAAVAIVLLGGAGVTYAFVSGMFGKAPDTNDNKDDGGATGYRADLKTSQDKMSKLIASGDEQSLQKAEQIADEQTKAAEESGDTTYIVEAQLAKAGLLIETGRMQEALDTILLPLEEKYKDDDAHRDQIYASIAWAYRDLGNTAKSSEYYDKIPVQGWD